MFLIISPVYLTGAVQNVYDFFSALILPYFRYFFNSCSFLEYMILRIAGGAYESNY